MISQPRAAIGAGSAGNGSGAAVCTLAASAGAVRLMAGGRSGRALHHHPADRWCPKQGLCDLRQIAQNATRLCILVDTSLISITFHCPVSASGKLSGVLTISPLTDLASLYCFKHNLCIIQARLNPGSRAKAPRQCYPTRLRCCTLAAARVCRCSHPCTTTQPTTPRTP